MRTAVFAAALLFNQGDGALFLQQTAPVGIPESQLGDPAALFKKAAPKDAKAATDKAAAESKAAADKAAAKSEAAAAKTAAGAKAKTDKAAADTKAAADKAAAASKKVADPKAAADKAATKTKAAADKAAAKTKAATDKAAAESKKVVDPKAAVDKAVAAGDKKLAKATGETKENKSVAKKSPEKEIAAKKEPKKTVKTVKLKTALEGKEKNGAPSQGYNEHSSEMVEHEDMKTMTGDWRSEWPALRETEEQTARRICREHPTKWCHRTGYGLLEDPDSEEGDAPPWREDAADQVNELESENADDQVEKMDLADQFGADENQFDTES